MPKYSPEQISRMLEAGKSPRFCRMEAYQKYWDGTIYEGRAGFMDQSSDTPLLERAPCIVYPIVRAAATSIVSMAMGLGKFPEILSMTSEDDTAFDPRFGLSMDESVTLDAGTKKISDQARLPAVAMQLAETALVSGTTVPMLSIVKGELRITQLDPKTCEPTFNQAERDTVDSVEVSYRYIDDYFDDSEKRWAKRVMQYRRIIDKTSDTVYVPIEIRHEQDFSVPSTVDKTKSCKHGFSFCPIIWYARGQSFTDQQGTDGKPIHWGLASQLDALNFSYSQRHRAALYSGDPQYWESGADSDDNLPTGRTAAIVQPTSINPQGKPMAGGWAIGTGRGGKPARKKGPGTVWSYASPEAKVGLLALPSGALKSIDEHAADLRIKVCEALGITFVDPSQLKGAGDISGKTLAFIFAHQVATCNAFREDFGRKCLLPLLNMIYRVILSDVGQTGLYLAGVKELTKVLQKFQAPVQGASSTRWFCPAQKLVWGPYFEPSDVDEATKTATAMQTWQAGGITIKTAVQHIQDIFQIQNVDQYVVQLQAENAAKAAADLAQQTALASATAAAKGAGKPGTKGKAGKGPFAKIDEPSAQAESASSNPVPKRRSPETRAWRKPSKLD